MTSPFRLAIVAGEASGDALALRFLETLRQRLAPREVIVTGVGGEALIAAGLTPLFPQADIAVMGFGPVVARLPLLLRRMEDAARGIARFAPDLLLTIDAPDFGLRVAKKVRARAPDIAIAHWVCPSVWAWRSGRARRMRPHIDRILALLPFEPAALERLHGPPTIYVGHPLIERLSDLRPDAAEAARRADLASPVVLVLPGSRRSEIRHLMPVFGQAIARIAEKWPGARFVLPAVPHLKDEIAQAVAGWARQPEIVLGEVEKTRRVPQCARGAGGVGNRDARTGACAGPDGGRLSRGRLGGSHRAAIDQAAERDSAQSDPRPQCCAGVHSGRRDGADPGRSA
ncbi:lipid A disaccharide synthetase [Bosea sp. OAE506]